MALFPLSIVFYHKKSPKHYICDERSTERFSNVIRTPPDYDAKWEGSADIEHSDPDLLDNYV